MTSSMNGRRALARLILEAENLVATMDGREWETKSLKAAIKRAKLLEREIAS